MSKDAQLAAAIALLERMTRPDHGEWIADILLKKGRKTVPTRVEMEAGETMESLVAEAEAVLKGEKKD